MLSIVGVVSPKRRFWLSQTVTICSILDGEQDRAHIGVQGTHTTCSETQLPILNCKLYRTLCLKNAHHIMLVRRSCVIHVALAMRRPGYDGIPLSEMTHTYHLIQIQFSAKMFDGKQTERSAVISLNVAGTRGFARLKCGNVIHDVRDCGLLDCYSVLPFIS